MPKKKVSLYNRSHMYIEYLSAAFFIAITAVFPLYITRDHYTFMMQDKATFYLIAVAIFSFVIIAILFLTTTRFQVKDYFIQNEPKRFLSVPEWALIAFLFLALLSMVFSPLASHEHIDVGRTGALGRRHEEFWGFICYGITFLIIARFFKPKRIYFIIFSVSASLVALYAILQFLDLDFMMRSGIFTEVSDDLATILAPLTRIFRTTLGNINIVSGYGVLVTVLFAGLFAGEDSKWGGFYLAASALCFSMLLITRGDAGRLGLVAGMALATPYWLADRKRLGKIFITLASWSVMLAIYNAYLSWLQNRAQATPGLMVFENDNLFLSVVNTQNPILFISLAVFLLVIGLGLLLLLKKWPEKPMKIAGIGLLVLMFIGGIVFIEIEGARRADNPNDIIWQAREMLRGRIEDDFGSARGFVWRHAFNAAFENPILGTGPGTFHLALSIEVQEEAIQRYSVIFNSAHNTYLHIAVTLGLPALVAYLVFLGSLLLPALKRAFNRPILLAFLAASLGYLVQSFFQVDMLIDRPLLWIAFGVIAGEIWRDKIGAGSEIN